MRVPYINIISHTTKTNVKNNKKIIMITKKERKNLLSFKKRKIKRRGVTKEKS